MPTESGEKKQPTMTASLLQPPKMTEPVACPRCASTSTKFCYYNNYNLSQPRHFCKSCRRYWTQGGTLRNVPVGGGTRKNTKRSRSSPKSVRSSTSSSTSNVMNTESEQAESESMSMTDPLNALSIGSEIKPETASHYTNLNVNENGNFTSLLNAQGAGLYGGYGSSYVTGYEEMGYGPNRGPGVWPIQGMGYVGGGAVPAAGCNTWQLSDVGGGLIDGDFLGWPGLTISMQGKGSK